MTIENLPIMSCGIELQDNHQIRQFQRDMLELGWYMRCPHTTDLDSNNRHIRYTSEQYKLDMKDILNNLLAIDEYITNIISNGGHNECVWGRDYYRQVGERQIILPDCLTEEHLKQGYIMQGCHECNMQPYELLEDKILKRDCYDNMYRERKLQ